MSFSTQLEGQNLLDFAQILYKCRLCSILPAVCTEKHEFYSHMQQVHFGASLSMVQCKNCQLTFTSAIDLQVHIDSSQCNIEDKKDKNIPFVISPPYSSVQESIEDFSNVKIKEEKVEDECSENRETTKSNDEDRSPSPVPYQQSQSEIVASLMRLQYEESDENEQRSDSKCDIPVPNFNDLKERFGRYASTIVMRGKKFFYCQICQDKCDTELQFKDHMNSSEHNVMANELEANTLAAEKRSPRRRNSPYFTSPISKANTNQSIGHAVVKSIVPHKSPASKVQSIMKNTSSSSDMRFRVQTDTGTPQMTASISDRNKRSLTTNDMSTMKKTRLEEDAQQTSPDGVSLVNLEKIVGNILEKEKTKIGSATNKTNPKVCSDEFSPTLYTCNSCDFKYSEHSQFVKHYNEEHGDFSEMPLKLKEGTPHFSEGLKAKELKEYIIATLKPSEHGCIGRQEILERFKGVASMPAAINWGRVCNNSIKATFPHAVMTRKGKLKKTYYQGVEFINPNPQRGEEQQEGSPQSASPNSILQEFEDVKAGMSEVQSFSEEQKIEELKQYMKDSLVTCVQSCVGRSELIESFGQVTTLTAAISWGPVCNRVVKELFPQVQIQRKGKYKQTYYFGIKLINQSKDSSQKEDLEGDKGQYMYSPSRDITKDIEKLVQNIPNIVRWSCKMSSCVPRDVLLQLAADSIGDKEVVEWSIQCNKAIRILYPEVFIKRRGGQKTTCYFGLELVHTDLSNFDAAKPWRNCYARVNPSVLASNGHFSLINQSNFDLEEIDDDSDPVAIKEEPIDIDLSEGVDQSESETSRNSLT